MNNNPTLYKQTGGASIIFVLLVSLVVLASTSNVFKTIKNNQEIGTAVNAKSHAESSIGMAVEAFGLYLETRNDNELRTLTSPAPIAIGADPRFGQLSADNVTSTEVSPNVFQINATLVNKHAAARASAKMQVVYNIVDQAGGPVIDPGPPPLSFSGGLELSGNVEILNNGEPVDLLVDGDLIISNVSIDELNEIHATGRVEIGSNEAVGAIFANDDVILDNTDSNLVRTMGTVTTTGDAAVRIIQSNDDVHIGASGRFDQIDTRGSITVNSGGAGQGILTAGNDITISNTGSVELAQAKGDIRYTKWFRVDRSVAEGDIHCLNANWNVTTSIAANGLLHKCPSTNGSITAVAGASNIVKLPDEITPINIASPSIDVWTLKDAANYFVEYDNATNNIMVTVKSVNGLIDDFKYTLGRATDPNNQYGAPFIDYLCQSVNSSGNCNDGTAPTLPICFEYSPYSGCISYNEGSKEFRISPSQTAPGVMFFDGNVTIDSGNSFTTILASGNIKTEGNFLHEAANSGGYEKVCEGDAAHASGGVQARYQQAYSTHYPTNLCDSATSSYTSSRTANIALAAGGINPDTTVNPNEDFTGGNIDLQGSSKIIGAVLAGNVITTNSGSVTIQGIVSAGARLNDGSANDIASRTIIDFNSDDDFDPFDIPDMLPSTSSDPAPTVKVATVVWSRPL